MARAVRVLADFLPPDGIEEERHWRIVGVG